MADLHEPEATLEAAWQEGRLPDYRHALVNAVVAAEQADDLWRISGNVADAAAAAARAQAWAAIADQLAIRSDLNNLDITNQKGQA